MTDQYTTIRSRIKARLDTLTGITNYMYEPDAIGSFPVTILGRGGIRYNQDMSNGLVYQFIVLLLVAEKDAVAAWSSLDTYLGTGSGSLKYALEGSSEAAPKIGDFCSVLRADNIGHVRYRDRTFIGAELTISIESGG